MPQSESHGEIRAELPFILDVPGAFGCGKVPRIGLRRDRKPGWDVLEHGYDAAVIDGSGCILRPSKQVLLRLVNPEARAPGVIPLGVVHIIGPGLGKPSAA